jgi:DNA-binding transcriptional ArsR family regulator
MPEPAEIFKVLGVDTRVKIIEILKNKGPLGVNGLAELLGITPAAVSQHLKVLKHVGMVSSERQGYHIPYSINKDAMAHCEQIMMDVCCCDKHSHNHHIRRPCDNDIKSMKSYKKRLEAELQHVEEKIKSLNK